ncbi:MAG TPA: glycoside hydrolase family 88 protein [Terracidiphilus sp.]|nr:glycoside hydrolase family 88 protein [Terracidiphilus sp.]
MGTGITKHLRVRGILFLTILALSCGANSQKPVRHGQEGAGDTPDVAGPPATDLSPALDADAIAKAMRKVGDWQLAKARADFSQDWTFATLYRGYLAAARSLHDDEYWEAMRAVGNKFEWQLGARETHADDQAIGFMYLELYRRDHEAKMLEPTKKEFDRVMAMPDVCTETCPAWHDQTTPMWWWCDALFMAPPVWAELAQITGNEAYLESMDRKWWVTSKLLYDPEEHLFYRDTSYLDKREANGKKVFWSRGNGWVIAGLAEVLDAMPRDEPSRPRYIEQFRQMAARVKSIQNANGLWQPGLLGGDAYPLPEVSGSAFFVYALAWGINHGVLDRKEYLPVVTKGWAGLIGRIYADGRLGSIQPMGGGPDTYKAQSSYVFGVGHF